MSAGGQPGPGGLAIDRYLAELTARLPGPPRARAGIVAELRSGLLDAADAHRSAGLPPAEADRAAIAEFGDPGQVAAGFRAEIAAGQARRVAVSLLVTGPLVGLLWIAAAAASHLSAGSALAGHWAGPFPGMGIGVWLVAFAAGVTAWGALAGIAATGRLTRWLPTRPRPHRRGGRRVRRGQRRRARPRAARGRTGHRPGKTLPAPGRRRGSGQHRPDAARQARRAPLPRPAREPDLTRDPGQIHRTPGGFLTAPGPAGTMHQSPAA